MYGLLRLVEVVREYGFDRGTTTGGDGESELLVLQYDDLLFLSLLVRGEDGSTRAVEGGGVSRGLWGGGLLSYDVGGIRWWRCLLSRVGLAEPGEPDEYGPDE